MKKLIILLLLPLFSFSQLAFIGEKSYPSTDVYEFENRDRDLYVSFLKDDDKVMVMLKTLDVLDYKDPTINGKMLIYLNDGKVITSSRPTHRDYVNEFCISIYPLTKSDTDAITNSNINSIRYALEDKFDDIRNRVATNESGFALNEILDTFIK